MAEEIDVEALQAQIDLSNSIAYDLVSSWMKPTVPSKPNTESVSKAIARELEEHAKRPPRLGLGAPLSKANVATARETARLKGKLIGAKRTRDNGGDASSSGAVQWDDGDEGESRSAAISMKKVKVNGARGLTLGLTNNGKGKGKAVQTPGLKEMEEVPVIADEDDANKKRKKKHHGNDEIHNEDITVGDSTSATLNPFVLPVSSLAPTLADTSAINLVSPSPARPTAAAGGPVSPKKKKHKKRAKGDANKHNVEDEEWQGFSNHIPELDDEPHEAALSPCTPSSKTPKSVLFTPFTVIDPTSPVRPTPSPSRQLQIDQTLPLLNLRGPLTHNAEERDNEGEQKRAGGESPKRKRRRRRGGRGGRGTEGGDGK